MIDVFMKQGDRHPSLRVQLYRDVSGVVDLTTASSVKFLMRLKGEDGVPKVSANATIEDRPTGIVRHDWGANDCDTEGTYYAEFEITWGDLTKETVPNEGYITILVKDDLG